jgi:dihydrofolate reductase
MQRQATVTPQRDRGLALKTRYRIRSLFRIDRKDGASIVRHYATAEQAKGSRRSERPRIERDFDPEAVRQWKASAGRDLIVGGPNLAARAFGAGLVDECHLFVAPVVVGGGKRSLPEGLRLELELMSERRFGSGVVYLHYRTRTRGDGP